MTFWRSLFPNRARWLVMRDLQNFDVTTTPMATLVGRDMYGHKILYFCGSHFQPEKFRPGEWRAFVETIP
jgi:hypothetical protein